MSHQKQDSEIVKKTSSLLHSITHAMPVKSIAPFFDSGVPPLPMPILTSETDVFITASPSSSLLTHENLYPSAFATPPKLNRKQHRVAAPARLTPSTPAKVRSVIPVAPDHSAASRESISSRSGSDCGEDEVEEMENDCESVIDSDDDDDKIAKPDGEPGRPGRGGYNLQKALEWDTRTFSKLKVKSLPGLCCTADNLLQNFANHLVDAHLDVSMTYTKQKEKDLQRVCDEVSDSYYGGSESMFSNGSQALEKFPELERYSDCWPVMDLVKMRLKYTSVRARRAQEKRVADNKLKLALAKRKKVSFSK